MRGGERGNADQRKKKEKKNQVAFSFLNCQTASFKMSSFFWLQFLVVRPFLRNSKIKQGNETHRLLLPVGRVAERGGGEEGARSGGRSDD